MQLGYYWGLFVYTAIFINSYLILFNSLICPFYCRNHSKNKWKFVKRHNFSLILYLPNKLAEMKLLEEEYECIKMHNMYCNLASKWKWTHNAIRITDSLIDKTVLSCGFVFHSLFIYNSLLSTCRRPLTVLSSLVLL